MRERGGDWVLRRCEGECVLRRGRCRDLRGEGAQIIFHEAHSASEHHQHAGLNRSPNDLWRIGVYDDNDIVGPGELFHDRDALTADVGREIPEHEHKHVLPIRI